MRTLFYGYQAALKLNVVSADPIAHCHPEVVLGCELDGRPSLALRAGSSQQTLS
jgi:hypothetical protein